MRQGLTTCRSTGAEIARPRYLALLAEAYGNAGQTDEGLALLAEALTVVQTTGERFYEAELYRLKGELSLQSGQVETSRSKPRRVRSPQSAVKKGSRFNGQRSKSLTPNTRQEAEECFQKAIEIAQRQSAKSRELRAVMSLSRLWQQRGKKDEARQMLAGIYGWFTEGFDTADLKEARVLLEELAPVKS